jgi:hypothetical protein
MPIMNRLRKKSEKIIPFTTASGKKQRINLIKEIKVLCNENYKTLKKTLKDGRISHVHESIHYCENDYTTKRNL